MSLRDFASVLLRPPDASELDAIHALLRTRDLIDLGFADVAREDLDDEWRAPGFDQGADAVVCELGGAVCGYAALRRTHALAAVAPGFEGRGIGTLLLEWTERRASEREREVYSQEVARSNARAARLLSDRGYTWVRSYTRMERALEPLDGPVGPSGLTLRPLELHDDARTLYAIDASSFAAVPDYRPMSFEQFRAEHLEEHDVAGELSLVAESHGRPLGFAISRRWAAERIGYVDVLAVVPEAQGAGVGTSLLGGVFERFAGAGLRSAQLGVASDNQRALALYRRMGMSERFQVDSYERAVVAAGR